MSWKSCEKSNKGWWINFMTHIFWSYNQTPYNKMEFEEESLIPFAEMHIFWFSTQLHMSYASKNRWIFKTVVCFSRFSILAIYIGGRFSGSNIWHKYKAKMMRNMEKSRTSSQRIRHACIIILSSPLVEEFIVFRYVHFLSFPRWVAFWLAGSYSA